MIKLIIIFWILILIYLSISKTNLFKNKDRNMDMQIVAKRLDLNYVKGIIFKKSKVYGKIKELSIQANWRTLVEQKSISTVFEFLMLYNFPLKNQFYITIKDRHISLPQEFPKGKIIKSNDSEFDSLINIYSDDNIELLSKLNKEIRNEILSLVSESYFFNISFKGIYLCTSRIDLINSEFITSKILQIKNLAELIYNQFNKNNI